MGIYIKGYNPEISGVTENFKVAIYKTLTRVIYDMNFEIPGVTITPGTVNGITLVSLIEGKDMSKKKIMDY